MNVVHTYFTGHAVTGIVRSPHQPRAFIAFPDTELISRPQYANKAFNTDGAFQKRST